MQRNSEAARGSWRGAAGGGGSEAGASRSRPQRSTPSGAAQSPQRAPTGDMATTFKDGLYLRGGRHVASLNDGVLHRTFDAKRELLHGSLLFHADLLADAQRRGAQVIEATERESRTVYRVSLAEFLRRSWAYTHAAFGAQRGLALTYWQRQAAGEAAQMTLWDGRKS